MAHQKHTTFDHFLPKMHRFHHTHHTMFTRTASQIFLSVHIFTTSTSSPISSTIPPHLPPRRSSVTPTTHTKITHPTMQKRPIPYSILLPSPSLSRTNPPHPSLSLPTGSTDISPSCTHPAGSPINYNCVPHTTILCVCVSLFNPSSRDEHSCAAASPSNTPHRSTQTLSTPVYPRAHLLFMMSISLFRLRLSPPLLTTPLRKSPPLQNLHTNSHLQFLRLRKQRCRLSAKPQPFPQIWHGIHPHHTP